ncbi:hypothetical protein IMSHALPRED_006755 [Imshaugia aleurites]|uniref:Uncharacterized protein n=1 Tax=Imshaugia aleurites TaxID=172621 RepID=A0A8H3FIC3_9LECA|nr:hypothetical protein IMSHALPRED_006755 [Imshaugia aleurites]
MRNATSFRTHHLLLFLLTLLPSTHSFDPCGPLVQDILTPSDTCNRSITLVTAPSAYGALLLNDGSGLNVTWGNCLPVIYDVCAAITRPSTPVGRWNWTDPGSECVMGFWLPQYPGSAPTPTYDACVDNVYTPMYEIGYQYGGTAYNQVVVNLKTLPDDYQTGEAVDVGYPSYTLTYLPLQKSPETPLSRG